MRTLRGSRPLRARSWGLQHHLERRAGGGEGTLPLTSGRLLQGMSETFETLHNLVHKGVKVVMDIPYELWNETSAEVADLKKQVGALRLSEAAVPPGVGGDGSAAEEGHQGSRDSGPRLSGFGLLGRIPGTRLRRAARLC